MKFLIKRKMALLFTTLLGIIIFSFILLLIYSPGKIDQYRDISGNPITGTVSEKTFVKIGGVKQGMFIRSKNVNNPVLLYLHGGPAFPNYFLIDKFNPGLEDYFTVCYWEQRGGGLSYTPDVTLESMNLDQLSSDAVEVTNYLRERFGKEKIYMLAHSGGTPIGLQAASQNPELYNAYIAMAQITNQAESEKIAYKYMLDQFNTSGNLKSAGRLLKYHALESDSGLISFYKSPLRDQYMHKLGIGTMHEMKSVFRDIFIPVWTCRAYTIREKFNIWKSKFSYLPKTNIIDEYLSTDFTVRIQKLDIPVYFISGIFDLTVNINLSKAYLYQLQAPLKGFYTFNNSAHSPLFEEPGRVRQIIEEDILNSSNNLADTR